MLQHADRTAYHGRNSGSSKQYRLLGAAALCLRVRLGGRWAARSINLLFVKDAQDMEDLKTGLNNRLDPCLARVQRDQKAVAGGARFGAHFIQMYTFPASKSSLVVHCTEITRCILHYTEIPGSP